VVHSDERFPLHALKKTIIIGILCCVALFFAAGYFARAPRAVQPSFRSAAEQPWNSQAIQSSLIGVKVRELDATHAAIDFVYDLQNRTSSDYQLTPGPSAVIMERLKADGSLSSDPDTRLVSAAFVPTNNRTRITVEMTEPFNWPAKQDVGADQSFRDFVHRAAASLEGFVIFDQASRYEIELPINLAASNPSH
jgi:hypothetical protein